MKMTEQERIELIKSITEGLATDKTFGEVIRKIKFQEGKIDVNGMTKEEKTIKFFKGLVEKDYATCKALNGTNEPTLVPEEFRAEVISRVEKSNFALINHVFTVPVDKRAGNIPVLDGGMTMKWGSAYPKEIFRYEWDIADFVCKGKRLNKTNKMRDQTYDLITHCWQQDPKERLTIDEIIQELNKLE